MTTLLSLSNLRKAYDGKMLLNIERCSLERGTTYLLQGDNGSGKTTLLRIMAGLTTADTGTMVFNGASHDVTSRRIKLTPRMIYVHQHSYIFHTSVSANIEYGLKLQGYSRSQRAKMVKEAMEWAGITHLASIPPHQLSGGQKQRLALARARVLKPELLLLDEPTANLDDEAREQLLSLIQQMRDDNNCVVIATHDRVVVPAAGIIQWRLKQGFINTC